MHNVRRLRCVRGDRSRSPPAITARLAKPVAHRHDEVEPLVWPSETGTPLSPSNLRRLLRRQCQLAGVREVNFHALRHSAATLLLAQGVPSPVILDVLGHQDVRMLRRYQHVTDSLRQDAANAIDRSFAVNLPVNDVAPGEDPGAT